MDIKKVFMLLYIGILLISFASSFEFDNRLHYEDNDKTVYIENAFGLGETIAKAEITSSLNNPVIRGYNRRVIIFDVENYGDTYLNALKSMDIKNMLNDEFEDKEFHYEYAIYEDVQVPIFEENCKNIGHQNGSSEYQCTHKIVKYNTEKRVKEWRRLENNDLPKGNITIALVTDVRAGDQYDAIPTLFGVKIFNWAVWNESLMTDLGAYWTLNETAGSSSWDSLNGTNNITWTDTPVWETGLIGNQANLSGGTQYGDSGISLADGTFSVSLWINATGAVTNHETIFGEIQGTSGFNLGIDSATGKPELTVFDGASVTINDALPSESVVVKDGQYNHVVLTFLAGSNTWQLYWNGTEVTLGDDTGALGNPAVNFVLGDGNAYDVALKGSLDEALYYNRVLGPGEVTQLYNEGLGLTYDNLAMPTVLIIYPSDSGAYNSSVSDLNYTVTYSGTLDKCWYSTNGGLTNSSSVNAGESNFTGLSSNEGSNTWEVYCNATDGAVGSDSVIFSIDSVAPTIIINAGNVSQNYGSLSQNHTINYTITDINLDMIWISYNGTNTTLEGDSGIQNTTNFQLDLGNYGAVIYANDSLNHLSTEVINWTYKIFENTRNYTSPTSEGLVNEFTINVTWDSVNYGDINAYLNYNNTRQSIATKSIIGNNATFITNAFAPPVSTQTNVPFFWEFLLGSQYINSTSDNQTVNNIQLAECNASYGDLILNLTLKDEEDNEYINLSALATDIEVDLSILTLTGETVINYSNQWTNYNNVSLCFANDTLSDSNYSIDFIIKFSAGSHIVEYFYLDNGTLSSSNSFNSLTTKNINLMDLLITDSTSFLFNYFDEDGLIIDDIIVHVFRKYVGEGLFREVERAKQNDDGDTVIHLVEEDVIYYFVISKNSEVLFTSNTYTALCQDTPCQIQIEESGGFQNFSSDWDLIDNGGYTINKNSLTRQVNLTYSLETPSEINLTVYKLDSDGSYSAVGSETSTGTSGTILIDVPTISGNTSFFGSVYQDGEFKSSQWIDFEEDAGIYFGNTLSLFLGALIILCLGLMAVSEGSLVIIFLFVGMFISMALGLIDYRTSTGLNILIYFIMAGGIILWKITRRNR